MDISEANIAKVNDLIETKTKSPEARMEMLKEVGLPKDSSIQSAVMLNNLMIGEPSTHR